jgi:hypothetical protein
MPLEHASVKQYCKALRVPVIGANFVPLAEQAVKEKRNHIGYLEALLAMEAEERDRHASAEAHARCAAAAHEDAGGVRLQPGAADSGTQDSRTGRRRLHRTRRTGGADGRVRHRQDAPGHGLCVAACRQKRRVRFTTAANLVNELVEAQQQNGVRRVLARWMRYDVIALDEVGYVPLAEIGAEFLFQVIAERAERATPDRDHELAVFGVDAGVSNPRLCKALLDRITDRAHIIETGTDSYRFRRTLEVRKKKGDRSGDAVVTASATT